MNSRERLRRCYYHEQLDRPGVYVRTYYPPDDPTYDRLREYLAAKSDLKLSWDAPGGNYPEQTEIYCEPHNADYERKVTILHTPGGDLRSTRLVSVRKRPGMDEEHLLKGRDDAEKFLSLPPAQIGGDVSGYFEADRQMGNRGIAEVMLSFSPGGRVASMFGSETFAMMTITDRDIVHALCERLAETSLAKAKWLIGHGVGPYYAMWGEEMIVPPLHSPADFDDFIVKYEKPIFDAVHDAGGRMHLHCHGSIFKLLPSMVKLGVDVLHPVEAPQMGDSPAAAAKGILRGQVCIEGNVQIADLYEKPPAEIAAQVETLIADTFDDRRGLIVCPSASPYQLGKGEECFEQFRAMVETVVNWRE